MNMREIGWRVFSKEFNSATLDISSSEERAPSYVVTPLGAKVNRVFVVGVITEAENIGSEEAPMIRARIADPAGNYYLSAGQFQPESTIALRELEPPEFVAVVGKGKVYSPEDSVRLLSIRPEIIRKCDAALRDYWIFETCVSMKRRIEIMKEAVKMDPATVQELEKLGYPKYLVEGAVAATNHYENIDMESYENLLADALREIVSGEIGEIKELDLDEAIVSPEADEVEIVSKPTEEIFEEDEDKEEMILQIVEALDKDGKGAKWEAIAAEAKKKGIEKERLEEICTDLMDKGDIYEPELGKIKKI